jgi:hypothetical protein
MQVELLLLDESTSGGKKKLAQVRSWPVANAEGNGRVHFHGALVPQNIQKSKFRLSRLKKRQTHVVT